MRSKDEIEQELDHVTKLIELRQYLPFTLGRTRINYKTDSTRKIASQEQPELPQPQNNNETPKEIDAYNRGLVDGQYEALLWTLEKIHEI